MKKHFNYNELKIRYFLLNVKSAIRFFRYVFCGKISMDTLIEINKKAEKICKEIAEYIQDEVNRDYIPSCEEFYMKYGYGIYDITPLIGNKELANALSKIVNQEIAMLKRYAILAEPEYVDSKGVIHKFDKKKLNKRFDKAMK